MGALRQSLEEMNVEVSDDEFVIMVTQLSAEGLIELEASPRLSSFSDYLVDLGQSGWMYGSLVLALVETLLVEARSTNAVLGTVRLLVGFALLGFLPGYSMMRLVFPRRDLPLLEQFMLSVFLSILISVLSGVVLGSLDNLQATSNTALLAVLTFGLSLLAAYRAFRIQTLARPFLEA